MKHVSSFKIMALLILSFAVVGCQKEVTPELRPAVESPESVELNPDNWKIIPGKYIVVFEKSELEKTSRLPSTFDYSERQRIVLEDAETILRENKIQNARVEKVYNTVVIGFTVQLKDDAVDVLRKHP